METKEERNYPYLVISIIYFLMYMLISQTNIHAIYSFFSSWLDRFVVAFTFLLISGLKSAPMPQALEGLPAC